MNKKKLVSLGAFLLAFSTLTSPVFAAGAQVNLEDESGQRLQTIRLEGRDQEVLQVREALRALGVGNIVRVSQETAIARDVNGEVITVVVGEGAWNPRWYPLDYASYLRWNTAWDGYYFPSYQEAGRFFYYDGQRYADYVKHYELLRQHYDVSLERSRWVKDGTVEKTTVYPRYILGVENTAFEGDRPLTRAEAAAMFARLVAGDAPIEAEASSYVDVKPEHWYYHMVNFSAQRGMVIAKTGEAFRPNEPISSMDFYQMLRQASAILGTAVTKQTPSGDTVSRREAVVAINRSTGRTPDHDYIQKQMRSPFMDVLADDPFYDELMTASSTHMESVWKDGIFGWSFHTPEKR